MAFLLGRSPNLLLSLLLRDLSTWTQSPSARASVPIWGPRASRGLKPCGVRPRSPSTTRRLASSPSQASFHRSGRRTQARNPQRKPRILILQSPKPTSCSLASFGCNRAKMSMSELWQQLTLWCVDRKELRPGSKSAQQTEDFSRCTSQQAK
eukprot:669627-Rhodomonas_salina.5